MSKLIWDGTGDRLYETGTSNYTIKKEILP